MEDRQKCPLLRDLVGAPSHCLRDECAWWIGRPDDEPECAMVIMAVDFDIYLSAIEKSTEKTAKNTER